MDQYQTSKLNISICDTGREYSLPVSRVVQIFEFIYYYTGVRGDAANITSIIVYISSSLRGIYERKPENT